MNRLCVSVVVPAYNRADLIGQTLDAILQQSRSPDEVIVVDDGSTDETAQVLRGYGDRLRVIRIPNSGELVARNTGLRAARCDLVAFCDSDDLWRSDYLESMFLFWAKRPDLGAAYSDFVEIRDNVWSSVSKYSRAPIGYWHDLGIVDGDYVYLNRPYVSALLSYQPMGCSSLIVRREYFIDLGGWDEAVSRIVGCDFATHLRLASNPPVGLLRRPLVGVRKHQGNFSGDNLRMELGDAEVLLKAQISQPDLSIYASEIAKSVYKRRIAALGIAYARGDLDKVVSIASLLSRDGLRWSDKLKIHLAKLPMPQRIIAWRLATWAGTIRGRLATTRAELN